MVHGDPGDGGRSADAVAIVDATPAAGAAAPPASAAAGTLTTTRLAHLLGINRRTVAKLRLRGAPASTDERAWRAWCRAHAIRIRPPLPALDLVVPRETALSDPAPTNAGAAQPEAAPVDATSDFSVRNWTQRKAQAGAELLASQTEKVQIELAEKRRVLIHRDDVARLVDLLAMTLLNELIDLPARSVQSLERLPQEWRRPVRRAIELEVDALRRRATTEIRRQVHAALAASEEATRAG